MPASVGFGSPLAGAKTFRPEVAAGGQDGIIDDRVGADAQHPTPIDPARPIWQHGIPPSGAVDGSRERKDRADSSLFIRKVLPMMESGLRKTRHQCSTPPVMCRQSVQAGAACSRKHPCLHSERIRRPLHSPRRGHAFWGTAQHPALTAGQALRSGLGHSPPCGQSGATLQGVRQADGRPQPTRARPGESRDPAALRSARRLGPRPGREPGAGDAVPTGRRRLSSVVPPS